MFSLLISGIIPASSTALPTIVTYFTTVMCMCSMSVVATVMVLVLHHRNAKNHTMPTWVRRARIAPFNAHIMFATFQIHVYVNQYLAWFLRMKRPGHDLSWQAIRHRRFRESTKYVSTPLLANSSKSLLANITHVDEQSHTRSTSDRAKNSPTQSDICDAHTCRAEFRSILTELRFLSDHVRQGEEDDDISEDWKFSAMVVDRLCLILFTIMTTIFSYVTLFSAPNFFKLR
jgi:nicotinic acetylcholine receptor, invertebrate